MAFDSLSEKLQNVFKNLRSKGRLTEDDVKTALKEVKMALLEADVNFRVVKKFVKDVQERAIGQDVMSGLNPDWKQLCKSCGGSKGKCNYAGIFCRGLGHAHMESVSTSAGGAAETGRKYNPAEDKKTGDQSNEEDRKMLYKQRIVMAAI